MSCICGIGMCEESLGWEAGHTKPTWLQISSMKSSIDGQVGGIIGDSNSRLKIHNIVYNLGSSGFGTIISLLDISVNFFVIR